MNLGILLMQMGGPDSPAAIRPFLRNLFADPDLIRVPGGPLVQRPLAALIAGLRARTVERYYALIGGASPLRQITEAQAQGLAGELERRGHHPVTAAVAMRYWQPLTGAAIARLVQAGCDHLLLLSLYPQFSLATTGSSLNRAMRILARRDCRWPFSVIEHWYDHPPYLAALAERVRRTAGLLSDSARRDAYILWSAHGLPRSFLDRGDPYARQVEATVAGAMARIDDLGLAHRIAYQSRAGPGRWLGPGVEEVLAEEHAAGRRSVVFVPVAFVSDHIETLYEIDILYTSEAGRLGYDMVLRTPSLNAEPDFCAALADLVEERLGRLGWERAGGAARGAREIAR